MSQDLGSSLSASMSVDRGPSDTYEAYNEEAFQHFMSIECQRAKRSARALLLLLVELRPNRSGDRGIAPAEAAQLFSALTVCLREVDFIGWYRSGRVIGGVLTQGAGGSGAEISDQIAQRVTVLLGERVPLHLEKRLVVRVIRLRGSVKG